MSKCLFFGKKGSYKHTRAASLKVVTGEPAAPTRAVEISGSGAVQRETTSD